jgi:hypothetical protein
MDATLTSVFRFGLDLALKTTFLFAAAGVALLALRRPDPISASRRRPNAQRRSRSPLSKNVAPSRARRPKSSSARRKRSPLPSRRISTRSFPPRP